MRPREPTGVCEICGLTSGDVGAGLDEVEHVAVDLDHLFGLLRVGALSQLEGGLDLVGKVLGADRVDDPMSGR